MKTYNFIQQEEKDYCVPACLQMVLDRNGLKFDSQKKIIEECGNKIHLKDTFDNYLKMKGYKMHCINFLVNQSLSRDFDILTREALSLDCDIIVGYAYEKLHHSHNEANHVSILNEYNKKIKPSVTLIDPNVHPDGVVYCEFDELIKSMFEIGNGFHIIHKDKSILETLKDKYN